MRTQQPESLSPRRGRPPAKLKQAIAQLRTPILSGEYPPGHRLESYDELGPKLNISRATLLQAISILKEDGFIESVERSNMFVSQRPPHLTRYGLVFHGAGTENRFSRALTQAAEEQRQRGNDMVIYHGIYLDSHHNDLDVLSYDVASHRLAGLIHLSESHDLIGTGAMEDSTLPKIFIRPDAPPGFTRVLPDLQLFTDRALDWLLSQGRRKLAVMGIGGSAIAQFVMRSCRARGVQIRPEWRFLLCADYLGGAHDIARLIGLLAPENRPDGLMILDEELIEPANAGFRATQVRVPDDIAIVARYCWPCAETSELPMMRIGFDAREMIHQAISLIDSARRRQAVGDVMIPARFESEIAAGNLSA